MEQLLERLVVALERHYTCFPWDTFISALLLICSWITIFLLLKERCEKIRPYMQISFELIRSSLACIVIRNVGTVPLEIKSLIFDEEFIGQLNAEKQEALKSKVSTNICVFPEQKWVISLDVNVFNIIKDFKKKKISIDYKYTKIRKSRVYTEKVEINFLEYKSFLNYISKEDELKRSIVDLKIAIDNLDKDVRISNANRG